VLEELLEEEEEPLQGVPDAEKEEEEKEEEKKERKEEAESPMKMQLVTMLETLESRQSGEIVKALDRVWANYRFLGIPIYRCHSDRAKEFISVPVQQWIAKHGWKQSVTGGDDPAANGRVEAEVNQVKRRLRLTMRTSKAKVEEWPNVARHAVEERNRAQLQRLGLRTLPMVDYNREVLVKTKRWHKIHTQGMASPYFAAKIKGPSPLMHNGWTAQDKDGKIQHVRTVLIPDPMADEAILEFETANPGPSHRITGKQPPDPRLRVPMPRLMSPGKEKEDEGGKEDEEPQDQPLPLPGADLSSLRQRETDPAVNGTATDGAAAGRAQTHVRRRDEEGQMKDTHHTGAVLVPGESVHWEETMETKTATTVAAAGMAQTHVRRRDEEGQKKDTHHVGAALVMGEEKMASCAAGGETYVEKCGDRRDLLQEGLRSCGGCGLLQPRMQEKCGCCEGDLRSEDHEALRDWRMGMDKGTYEEILERRYVSAKKLMKEIARELPVGGERGLQHGELMEQVDGYVTKLEEDLHGLRQEEKSEAEDRCHMAALQAGGGQEAMQQALHTHTISLAEVRKNLGEWREALLQEYHSLTVATKAVVPVKRRDLQHRQDVEYAPGKLVATIKAPSGKRKARIVVCGNRVEASLNEQDGEGQDEDGQATSSFGTRVKGFEHYASGTDGTVVRALLRKASHCGWSGATTDVRTAFLLAPRGVGMARR